MLSLTEKETTPGATAGLRLLLVLSVFCIGLVLNATPVLAAGSSASKTTIKSVRLWRAPDHTRLVFDLSATVEHKIFTLDKPRRLVIDVKHTAFATQPSQLKLANTPITELRSAQFDGNNLRIVLELREEINPRSFVLERNEQYGDRLVIDLYDRAKHSEKTVGDALAGQKSRDIIIAIDAGHGGEDPGATGPKRLREKNVVLAISRAMQGMINREPGFRAVMVRDGDYYIPLRKRTDIARKHRADLMVSIHADAFNQASANG
ncbi:MAG: N-acetylmuramoyl-L-alanine amidase, partial [Gammaproteobacteria bacterium]|nr:N-acetylmuramoyl-L-alanine amidase [Gammaproteobacteria bacterium]